MSAELFARRVPLPGDLPQPMSACDEETGAVPDGAPQWTEEQRDAIERRDGDLLLDAAAGSGKTSVLVERFVRSVLEDGVAVEAILTITFTEKAAAEMRDRIRARLRAARRPRGRAARPRARSSRPSTASAPACCASHALAAGLDPQFAVLDEPEAARIGDAAFDEALEDLARNEPGVVDLIAGVQPAALRDGDPVAARRAALARPAACRRCRRCRRSDQGEIAAAREALAAAASELSGELAGIDEPGVRVVEAIERIGRCIEALEAEGDECRGPPSSTAGVCPAQRRGARARRRAPPTTRRSTACEPPARTAAARPVHDLLDRLLRALRRPLRAAQARQLGRSTSRISSC